MVYATDGMWAPVWLGVTLLLGGAAWAVVSRLFPEDTRATRIGHAVLIGWAQIALAATGLGAVGWLTPAPLLAAVAGLSVMGLILGGRGSRRAETEPGSAGASPPRKNDDAPGPNREPRLWNVVWIAVAGFWAGQAVTGGLLRFPEDWDTLMYHLPLVDLWVQAGSLYNPDGLRWSDPGNNELIALWLVTPFSGDFLYGLNNLPATVLLACGAVEVGRQLGWSAAWRNLGALAVTTNHVVFRQLADAGNDVAVAALFLTTLGYGLRYAASFRSADLVLGCVALGLLAGVKFFALGYAAVAGVVLAGVIARRQGWRAAGRAAAAGAVGLLLFGGYWYARNWLLAGSPLYPLGAPAAADALSAWYPNVWATTFVGNGRPELFGLSLNAVWTLAGPCHLAALVAVPVVVVWLVIQGFQRRAGDARLALAAAAVGTGAVLVVTPFAVEDAPGTLNQMRWMYCPVRYGLTFLSTAVLGLVCVLDAVARRPAARNALAAVFAVGVAYQFVAATQTVPALSTVDAAVMGGNVLLVGLNLWLLTTLSYRLRRIVTAGVVVVALAGGTAGIVWLSDRWHAGHAAFYDLAAGGVFAELARDVPPGAGVCVLDRQAYPFFGPARQYRVCQPAAMRSAAWWHDYLRARGVRLVAARFDKDDWYGWKAARGWLASRPDLYELVRDPPVGYTVYRVRNP